MPPATTTGSEVIKVIHAAHAVQPGFARRLAEEIAAARRIEGLHTVPVVAADTQAEGPWVATAYADGPSIRDLVRRAGPLPVEQ